MIESPKDPARVRSMFGGIARHYDLLNHVLSANFDRGWRRRAVARIPSDRRRRVLDLCGGTGDLTVELARRGAEWVVCCDFARPMLQRAAAKFERLGIADRCGLIEGDALRLPFEDAKFDAVTIGFGIRNLADLDAGLREMLRVLRPGGALVILEFSVPPSGPLAVAYRQYLKRILPKIGDRVAGRRGPYGYLARTIAEFPDAPTLAARAREAGFGACDWELLTGGIVAVHRAVRRA